MSPMHGITRLMLSSTLCSICTVGTAFAATTLDALQDALAQCAVIAGRDERLGCFDALASQQHPVSAPAAAAPATAAATAAAPVERVRSVPAVPGEFERPEDFGLDPAQRGQTEHRLSSITAGVSGFSRSKQGKIQADLDNGQAWELDEADPLLAPGDAVTIRRATLGSYLLTTPSKRLHRVRRTR
jgi:hypothetical protein